jgi:hypothetical protein
MTDMFNNTDIVPPNAVIHSRSEQIAIQREADERARSAAAEETVRVEQNFPDCIICGNYLNNADGPDPTDNCRSNCDDVVNVCRNNHLFHRACILNSCNAGEIDLLEQMNVAGSGEYTVAQSIATICPICRSPLLPSCEGMRTKTRVATANIGMDGMEINLTGGKRKRKTMKHIKHRKHKKTNKHKKHKKTNKHKRGGKHKKTNKRKK